MGYAHGKEGKSVWGGLTLCEGEKGCFVRVYALSLCVVRCVCVCVRYVACAYVCCTYRVRVFIYLSLYFYKRIYFHQKYQENK